METCIFICEHQNICPTYIKNSTYQTNLNNLLSTLTSQASFYGFYNTSIGEKPDQVYGLYLCRGDINSQNCGECVYQAHNMILQQCPSQIWAMICPSTVVNNPQTITINETRALVNALNKTLPNFATQVANNVIKFGTNVSNITRSQKLYSLGQCTPDLIHDDCDRCLMVAIGQLPHTLGGRVLQPSCNIRFEVSQFYSDSVIMPPDTGYTLSRVIKSHPSDMTYAMEKNPTIDGLQYKALLVGSHVWRECEESLVITHM
ncbi:hypothetical protein RND81_10G022800 [Saponaria officinalis]|uniref:Gnk2-homologous domain-containing protein n=1 Tax=Saponaria officinalis TaxID=3572 RepID=A0AAW1HZT5_SAPOF